MLKKLVLIAFTLPLVAGDAVAMQPGVVARARQQNQQRKQKPKPKPAPKQEKKEQTPKSDYAEATTDREPTESQQQEETTEAQEQEAQNTNNDTQEETKPADASDEDDDEDEDTHECVFGPEHPRCGICGCDGISEYGHCSLAHNGCDGRKHILICAMCGLKTDGSRINRYPNSFGSWAEKALFG